MANTLSLCMWGEMGWSKNFTFVTASKNDTWSPSIAIYGDLGYENAQIIPLLLKDIEQNLYDAVIHVGDIAYDLDTNNSIVGNNFMRLLEPIASSVPYMVCPGNHERKYNFSNYIARFNMPHTYDNLWYSFNMGPIHFVSYSTEVYYFMEYGLKLVTKQFEWLENDLKVANKPENRKKRPWVITYGHRPFYCSSDLKYDCNKKFETMVRRGIPGLHWFGLENLFYKYSVDVEIFGHEHFYTRLWPIYNFKMYNGSTEKPYTNAKAPIHIVTGAGGSKERKEEFTRKLPSWNAFHNNDYGYSRLKAFNYTHLYFEFISSDQNGTIIDQFWVIKNQNVLYNVH